MTVKSPKVRRKPLKAPIPYSIRMKKLAIMRRKVSKRSKKTSGKKILNRI